MSVLPPGATNSKLPPWATASSPVEHPASKTHAVTAAAVARASTNLTVLPAPSIPSRPSSRRGSRTTSPTPGCTCAGSGNGAAALPGIARRSVSTGNWWLTHTARDRVPLDPGPVQGSHVIRACDVAGTARPMTGWVGLRRCHQLRGSRSAPSPGETRCPSKTLVRFDQLRRSVSTGRPCRAAMGVAVS